MKVLLIITILGDYGCYPLPPVVQSMDSMQQCIQAANQVEIRFSRVPGTPFTADGKTAPRDLRVECVEVGK